MSIKNLSSESKLQEGIATTGAGTSTINGATLDTQGLFSVLFVVKFGTPATDNQIKAQQGDLSDLTDASDLLGTLVTVSASDEIVWLDLLRPTKRYVRVVAVRGTSTTIDWGIAVQYGARKLPIDNTIAGTIAGEVHPSPAEGTA